MKYTDSMTKMAQDHVDMKNWHESMAKSSADRMQDHIKAAAWHDSQSNLIKSMINEVPLDPEKKVATIPSAGGGTTAAPSSGSNSSKEVPLDPETVRKSDLISILNQHAQEHGGFDMDVEAIANFLLNK